MKKLVTFIVLIVLANASQAHVPLFPINNENITSAFHISDPNKSWAIYDFLRPKTAQYYSFDLEKGQDIHLALMKSTSPTERYFKPDMVLLGPGLETNGQLPFNVSLPNNFGILQIPIKSEMEATYEPFGPSSYYQMTNLDITAPESSRYLVAVYSNQTPGHYSLAIGSREEFSFAERIILPLRLISIYIWEGQSWAYILIAYLIAILIGFLLFWRRSIYTAFALAGTLAGMLFLGTSASVLAQIFLNLTRAPFGPEVYISIAIAIVSAILGVAALRLSGGEAGLLQRIALAVIGTTALLAGSGLIIGPLLAITASVLPSKM